MKKLAFQLIFSLLSISSFAQNMGINVPTTLAPLHVSSNHSTPEQTIIRADGDDALYALIQVNAINPSAIAGYSILKNGVFFAMMGVNTSNDFFIKVGSNTPNAIYAKSSNNMVGINNATPTANLDVNGTVKLGVNGTVLTNIIKVSVIADIPSIPANNTVIQTFIVPNAVVGSTVIISPDVAFAQPIIIYNARVSAANTVQLTIRNTSPSSVIDIPSMTYHIAVIL